MFWFALDPCPRSFAVTFSKSWKALRSDRATLGTVGSERSYCSFSFAMTPPFDHQVHVARQADSKAIAALLDQQLPPRVTAKVLLKNHQLQVMLTGEVREAIAPMQEFILQVRGLVSEIHHSNPNLIQVVKIYGWCSGEPQPQWHEQFEVHRVAPKTA
jgi:hypothetical protein